VLVCAGSYLPGYKSGGPIRSIANIVSTLSDQFDFYVVTRDRDATDASCYPSVTPDKWCRVGNAHVLYCSSPGPAVLRRAFRETRPSLIYLNSFHDSFTRILIGLRRMGAFGSTPVLLAPRGEFSAQALKLKRFKKTLYRHTAKLIGLHEHLNWHVTSVREKDDLLKVAPGRGLHPDSVYVVGNLSVLAAVSTPHIAKQRGAVKLAYIARMSEIKNLGFLMKLLPDVRGQIELNLFGAVEKGDAGYWRACMAQVSGLPGNIKVRYQGALDHSLIPQVLHEHHFFILPTKSENFCHSAVESFANGTPVILSDETPWIGLAETHAGFDIPLFDRERWVAIVQMCVDMDQAVYKAYLSGAMEYGRRFSIEETAKAYIQMFESVVNKSRELDRNPSNPRGKSRLRNLFFRSCENLQ
jgi:glycosyltransferase involved in cell wall biosynthesis